MQTLELQTVLLALASMFAPMLDRGSDLPTLAG
jgi:hypothetical protein